MPKLLALTLVLAALGSTPTLADESATIEFFQQRGARVTLDDEGHATKLFLGGKPQLSVEDLQRIGNLVHLEQLAINAAPAGNDGWGFLQKLPKLQRLTLWHAHHIRSLAPFSGLSVEAITFGGCMGLRNLNQDVPAAQRDAVLSLTELHNLTSLTLYHSPLTPDDRHLAHIVAQFPKLTELRLDFAAPRGQEINITADGLATLAALPLKKLTIENADDFTPEVFAALGQITTLEHLEIFPAKGSVDAYKDSVARYEPLLLLLEAPRPNLEVTLQKAPAPRE